MPRHLSIKVVVFAQFIPRQFLIFLTYLRNELNKIPPEGWTPAVRVTLYRQTLGEKSKKRSKVDSATSSGHPLSEATSLIDIVAFQQGWEKMHNGIAELTATMTEFKTIKADVYPFMHRNSKAVTGPFEATTRIDTVSELIRPISESPMMVTHFSCQGFHYIRLSPGHTTYFSDNCWGDFHSRCCR
ncbi:uncharacterized protein LOC127251270 isoform X2 [Andrographis paniculata]|uniref:uncharacterized protein LOC127251270 isoform X2 n=1 Tax=Andrographis paniculata TaxID=175694 RepID=UPI0021E746CE|nr:uncharacterized protein LOC127251270 isoform X2 [Andrographis paniculata]